MSGWIKCSCLNCSAEFEKMKADLARSPNSFCSKSCSAQHRAKVNADRFYERCEKTSSCWNWKGNLNSCGYGYLKIKGRVRRAHQASYEISRGPIHQGMVVMHSCDNPACVNPDHLSLGTHLDNMRDMRAKGRGASKLNAESARLIRASTSKTNDLAELFGVSVRAIRNIRSGASWNPLPSPPTE
ncbi:HNH endonuclease signature motif containing protein [Pseudomonas sp. UBA2522]|uniref:HNH endonuclease signature motif containing protein n=1 Tax=Pseudomonas sp. UBA2522 TaxID=1947309 RepID=UPI00257E2ADD|nr:HNH endonuclease signature motif containing protein [Pseudomonas sp. UBA2522]